MAKQPRRTEQTAKKYRAIPAVGVLVVVLGMALAGVSLWLEAKQDYKPLMSIAAFVTAFMGVAILSYGVAAAWWHHR